MVGAGAYVFSVAVGPWHAANSAAHLDWLRSPPSSPLRHLLNLTWQVSTGVVLVVGAGAYVFWVDVDDWQAANSAAHLDWLRSPPSSPLRHMLNLFWQASIGVLVGAGADVLVDDWQAANSAAHLAWLRSPPSSPLRHLLNLSWQTSTGEVVGWET